MKPKCYKDDKFLVCYCGKCEAESYPLPNDFKRIMKITRDMFKDMKFEVRVNCEPQDDEEEPTQPTQEKEKKHDVYCEELCICDWDKQVSQAKEKPTQNTEDKSGVCCTVDFPCPKHKPRLQGEERTQAIKELADIVGRNNQDTEPWEEEFDEEIKGISETTIVLMPKVDTSCQIWAMEVVEKKIKAFIKQKKQEWREEWTRAINPEDCWQRGRTQGAEAAVKKIISSSPIIDPVQALGDPKYYRVSSEVLEEAKKV